QSTYDSPVRDEATPHESASNLRKLFKALIQLAVVFCPTTNPPPSLSRFVQGVFALHITGQDWESASAITWPKFSPAVGKTNRSAERILWRTSSRCSGPLNSMEILSPSCSIWLRHRDSYSAFSNAPTILSSTG